MEKEISVYPVLTDGELTIQNNSTEVLHFELYNALGEKIMNRTLSGKSNRVDLYTYANNIYFYKITSGNNKVKTGKIIKQ